MDLLYGHFYLENDIFIGSLLILLFYTKAGALCYITQDPHSSCSSLVSSFSKRKDQRQQAMLLITYTSRFCVYLCEQVSEFISILKQQLLLNLHICFFLFFSFLKQSFTMQLKLSLNSRSSGLSFCHAGIISYLAKHFQF